MQPCRRERSSSVVLLGKLSAIVRRGSLFQEDSEDAHSSSNDKYVRDKESENGRSSQKGRRQHTRRRSVGATPSIQSNLIVGNSSQDKRLQFYPAWPLVAAKVSKPLGESEIMRRAALEANMKDFKSIHATFAPLRSLDDQDDNEMRTAANGSMQIQDMDNNKHDNHEVKRWCATLGAYDDGKNTSEALPGNEESLGFDTVNWPTSMRRLMDRIKSESLVSDDSEGPFESLSESSNHDDDNEIEDGDVNCINDVEELELDNNVELLDKSVSIQNDENVTYVVQASRVNEMIPAAHMLLHHQVALSTQDQLTASVRRLVIQLKNDSDEVKRPLTQTHGIQFKSKISTRRRAGSCPTSYDLGVQSPIDGSLMSTQPHLCPTRVPQEMPPGKKHKKSAFSRIGPRVLESLHLRKKPKTYLFTDEELETIEGARWKIVELAFRFGGKHRSYLVQAVNMFFPLLKYGRRGGAHTTRLHCNCCGTLQWQHKRGGLSKAVDLAEVLQVLGGRQTSVFRKYTSNNELAACSFSVVFRGRTLDLETQSLNHRDWLISALRTLVAYARRQRRIEQQAIAERTKLPLEEELPLFLSPVVSARERAAPLPFPMFT
ncbi:uncharacterized protein CCR75_000212 [Bremia lactucae]|uniref:Uncharacterized protein n=1 Tax=Bremia lactucae TaxID=4779 RepID=A0A976FDZ7_BRELC|nr:hypothetical protein CCR75_000212 [Bremia lactucae]